MSKIINDEKHRELDQGTRKGMPLLYDVRTQDIHNMGGHPLAGALARFSQENHHAVACR